MVVWRDQLGRQVAHVTQGIAQTSVGLRAAYFAETVVGAITTGFPRFQCAVKEVEKRLSGAGIRAVRTM